MGKSHSYGWIFSFIPRHCAIGMYSEPAPLGRLIGIELLADGVRTRMELALTAEVAAMWEAQWLVHGLQGMN